MKKFEYLTFPMPLGEMDKRLSELGSLGWELKHFDNNGNEPFGVFMREVDTTYIEVKALKDESSHWYVIPAELANEFNNLLEKSISNEDAEVEFINKFSQYMTGGCLSNQKLYIKN